MCVFVCAYVSVPVCGEPSDRGNDGSICQKQGAAGSPQLCCQEDGCGYSVGQMRTPICAPAIDCCACNIDDGDGAKPISPKSECLPTSMLSTFSYLLPMWLSIFTKQVRGRITLVQINITAVKRPHAPRFQKDEQGQTHAQFCTRFAKIRKSQR